MKRIAHKLTRNVASTRPQYLVFLDTETGIERVDSRKTRYPFQLGVAHYWRRRRDGGNDSHEWIEFTNAADFWNWLDAHCHSNSVTYLVAHNVLFDLATLDFLNELPRRGWSCQFAFDGQNVAMYKFRRARRTLCCIDNGNIFRGKLADWANAIQLPKVEVDFENATLDDLRVRCSRDVVIMSELWKWWLNFLDEHDMGTFKPTIAGQALAAWRHRFMHYPVYCHNNADILALERASYHGGRVEPFRIGKFTDGPYYKLDVNSMYPAAMRWYRYPNNLVRHGGSPRLAYLAYVLERDAMIADVSIDITEPWFPVKRGGRNVYPVGEFRTVLTTEELRLCLERGWIREIHSYARYTMRDLFSEFVDTFYALKAEYRAQGKNVLALLIKDMLNSLHGKLAQRGIETRVLGEWDPDENHVCLASDGPGTEPYKIRYIGGQVIEERKSGESFNSLPAVAAHVAANARLYLYQLVQEAGDGNVLYCDTDCLVVNSRGYDRLSDRLDSARLGKLKVEGVVNEIEIRGPKDYTFGIDTRVKGIPRDAHWLDDSSAEVELWPGLNTYLGRDDAVCYQTRTITRHLSRNVTWGRLGPDGWIEPFRYPEKDEDA